jgi:hypothetical protein
MVRSFALRAARAASLCSRVVLIALATAVAVLALVGPDWAKWLGSRRASAGAAAVEQSETSKVLLRRIAAKDEVIDRLLAGDLTLLEAAAWFRRLNADPPHLAMDYSMLAGDSEEEKVCRQVISWVGHHLAMKAASASEAHDVVHRLEGELQERLRRDGRVELPW